MPTMRSSSSSSEGLPHVTGLNWEGSVESNEVKHTSAETPLSESNTRHTDNVDLTDSVRLCLPGL